VLGDLTLAIPLLALAGTSFLLGARHGLDWDHIAAITDLTSPRQGDEDAPVRYGRRGLGLALAYCIGHGLVLAVFAGLILLLGIGLPAGLDALFEYLVGLTLVTLGAVVLYQLGRYRSDYRYAGRISLVVGGLRRGWARARRREVADDAFADVDRRGAFLVGLLHGTGASTPTQVVLFATTAAAGSTSDAAVVLAAFVLGLIVTDLGIAAAWVSGLVGARRAPTLQLGLGVVTGVASVTLGALILTGYGDLVPPLVAEG
jgi:hypothetical protein